LTKDQAREKLRGWYKNVSESKIKEIISAKDCIKYKEEQVLNFFDNYSTNAAAESLNSKMKGFRAELRGISDFVFLHVSLQPDIWLAKGEASTDYCT
jgi:transposase